MKDSHLGRGRPGKFLGKEAIGRLQKKQCLILFADWQVLWQSLAVRKDTGWGKAAGARPGAGAQRYQPIPTHSQEYFTPCTAGRVVLSWTEANKEREDTVLSATECPLRLLSSLHHCSQKILMARAWDAVPQDGSCLYHLWLYKPLLYLPSTLSSKLKRIVYSASQQAEVILPLWPSLPPWSVPLLLDPLWDWVTTVFKPQHAGRPYLPVICLVWLFPDNPWHPDCCFNSPYSTEVIFLQNSTITPNFLFWVVEGNKSPYLCMCTEGYK